MFGTDLFDDDIGNNVKEENDPETNKVLGQRKGSVKGVRRRSGVGWIRVVPSVHVRPGHVGFVKIENICGS